MLFEESVELVAKVIDAVGVAVIVGGVVLATTLAARSGADWDQRFREYRRGVGRSTLLGLEINGRWPWQRQTTRAERVAPGG